MLAHTAIIAVFLILLVTILSIYVSACRIRLRISMGDGGNKVMRRAIRTHANSLEHAIPFVLLLMFYELNGGTGREVLWLGGLFLGFRLMHVSGMLGGPFRLRQLGATGSLVLEVFVAFAILCRVFGCPVELAATSF